MLMLSETHLGLRSAKHQVPFRLRDIVAHILGPFLAALLQVVHAVAHYIQVLRSFVDLPLHVSPVTLTLWRRNIRGR